MRQRAARAAALAIAPLAARTVALLLCALAWASAGAQGPPVDAPPERGFARMIARALPGVISVYAIEPGDAGALPGEDGDDPPWQAHVGAGFLVDGDGHAVTSAHVLERSLRVIVKLADDRVVVAEKVGEDAVADIALLRLPVAPRPPVMGSADALQAGDWVVAIGDPFGLTGSVTVGVVGAKDRQFADTGELLFIQSDLVLHPGNSGGPLLDRQGRIVGMNARTIVSGDGGPGLSLSVPIDIVLQVAAELKQGDASLRPRLGAQFKDPSPAAALAAGRTHARGALVTRVARGSLAQRMDLRPGDVVVRMNGRSIARSADLARALWAWRSTRGTRLTVVREGEHEELALP